MGAIVLKIGGSLLESDAAAQLMRGLAGRGPDRLVIVPGGGDFADTVRTVQSRHALGEGAAHHMALLAMHMVGIALADLAPGFEIAETADEFAAAWQRGITPVWAPARMVLASDIRASWEATSDSLAAWLAGQIGAERLVLAKSCAVPVAISSSAQALSAAGIVDAGFAEFVEGCAFGWRVASGPQEAIGLVCPEQQAPLESLETVP